MKKSTGFYKGALASMLREEVFTTPTKGEDELGEGEG